MPTMPGVIRLTTGAKVWTGAPSANGIGAPARTGEMMPVVRAIPPETTSADKTRFIAVETLDWQTPVSGKQTARMNVSGSDLITSSRHGFKGYSFTGLAALSATSC